MSTVNIPSYHDDPNYRYRMPKVKAKIEGRGNGIKTNIVNMSEIAKALKRSPEYTTKFCGCELGALSKFVLSEGKAIVNGVHTEQDLQIVMDKFIEKFVLCPKCKLPEIDLFVASRKVQGKCNACGFSGNMDNIHKVATFICKNPPTVDSSTVFSEEQEKSWGRRGGKKKTTDTIDSDETPDLCDSVSTEKDKSKKESKTERKERKEKQKQKRKIRREADEQEFEEIISILVEFTKKIDVDINGLAPERFFEELRVHQLTKKFDSCIRIFIALKVLFNTEKIDKTNLEKRKKYFFAVIDNSVDERAILKGFEMAGSLGHKEIFDNYATITHWLYENDLVSETAFLKRYQDYLDIDESKNDVDVEKNRRIRAAKSAKPFLTWLKEAESASDSSSVDSNID